MARRQPDPYNGPKTLGIDLSKWNGEVDFDKLAKDSEVKFVISRTGDGKDSDPTFATNWKRSYGWIRGSYHYFRADRDGKSQADLVLSLIDTAGGLLSTDLPPAIDIEDGVNKNLPGGVFSGAGDLPIGLVVDECLEFLEVIEEQTGKRPLVYTGQTFHWWLSQRKPDLAKEFSKYPLWTPDYRKVPRVPADVQGNPFPWKHWTIWQFTSKRRTHGVKTLTDANYFRGSLEDLQKFVKSLSATSESVEVLDDDCVATSLHYKLEDLYLRLKAEGHTDKDITLGALDLLKAKLLHDQD